jgi:hypothetical protein
MELINPTKVIDELINKCCSFSEVHAFPFSTKNILKALIMCGSYVSA